MSLSLYIHIYYYIYNIYIERERQTDNRQTDRQRDQILTTQNELNIYVLSQYNMLFWSPT